MKTNFRNILYCCVTMIAVFSVITMVSACGRGSSTPATTSGTYYGNSPNSIAQFDFTGLTLTTIVDPDYPAATVVVSNKSTVCAAKILTEYSEFTLSNSGACGSFTLPLQYVPALSLCQPGGLYLHEGSVTSPEDGLNRVWFNVILAAWDAQGNFNPWITAFDTPTLISQTFQSNWRSGDPLNKLGSWTYNVDYISNVIPPTACSLKTTVELTVSGSDENTAPEVYHYDVTEINTGGQITASISANEPNAPKVFIEREEGTSLDVVTRHISFVGLDVLRDPKVRTSIAFIQHPQVVPIPVTFPNSLSPHVSIDQEIDIALDYPPAPLASHLARFFSEVTAPLKAVSRYALVTITGTLSTPLGGGISTAIPLVYVPYTRYTPGVDDNNDCTILPNPGLICNLAAAITTAAGSPDPSASYILGITFFESTAGAFPPLAVQKAVLPVSKIKRIVNTSLKERKVGTEYRENG